MNRLLSTMTILAGLTLIGAGWAAAQTPSKAHEGHHEVAPAKTAPGTGAPANGMGKMGMGMMGGEKGMCPMMGGGGMGAMGGGMGAMLGMGGPDTQVSVKNTDKGVTITLTTTDPAKVARLQKMAEALRLMHEATAP